MVSEDAGMARIGVDTPPTYQGRGRGVVRVPAGGSRVKADEARGGYGCTMAFARPQIAQRVWIVRGGVSRGSCFCSAAKWEAAYAEGSLCFGRKFVGWLERDMEQACTPAIPEFFAGGSFAEACG